MTTKRSPVTRTPKSFKQYVLSFLSDDDSHVAGSEWWKMATWWMRSGGRGPAGEDPEQLWKENGAFLREYIRHNPGKRPSPWWSFEAPEPRRRLGGTGTPCSEVLAYKAYFSYGLPGAEGWITQDDVEMYGDDFEGKPIDPDDPPVFESQASYLDRLGLLVPGERERIPAADFEPEVVEANEDDE